MTTGWRLATASWVFLSPLLRIVSAEPTGIRDAARAECWLSTPEQSQDEHERVVPCAEGCWKRLELSYRTMLLCAGDVGFGARKTLRLRRLAAAPELVARDQLVLELRRLPSRRINARFREGRTEFCTR